MDKKGHNYHWKLGHMGPISDENEYLTIEAFWGIEIWFQKFEIFIWNAHFLIKIFKIIRIRIFKMTKFQNQKPMPQNASIVRYSFSTEMGPLWPNVGR